MVDFFEVDRLVEELAKIFASQLAVSWYKVNKNKNPSETEFRNLVVDFMRQFEYSISRFPDTEEGIKFKNYCQNLLKKEIELVLKGKNKEVEKRYIYYTKYY